MGGARCAWGCDGREVSGRFPFQPSISRGAWFEARRCCHHHAEAIVGRVVGGQSGQQASDNECVVTMWDGKHTHNNLPLTDFHSQPLHAQQAALVITLLCARQLCSVALDCDCVLPVMVVQRDGCVLGTCLRCTGCASIACMALMALHDACHRLTASHTSLVQLTQSPASQLDVQT
jgi:hypothetical protein